MKLLGWMHRKFRQNSNEPFKDFAIGQASLDDLQYHSKPNYYTKPLIRAQADHQFRKSFASLEAERIEEDELENEEASAALSDLFHGFLAIGTLGTDPVINDPSSTPTFSISVENIMEKDTEVTENELKLINDELERVLGADEISCNVSSGRNSYVSTGRNSHVSAGRSSHCSTITLSGGKPLENTENNGSIVCPLQGYLLGSAAIGLPETTTTTTTPVSTAAASKKENRTSLGELFQRTKAEENSGTKFDREHKKLEKETDKSAVFLMKKLLKKKILQASKSSVGATAHDPASAETKLHKILHIFHRKVHPDNSDDKKSTQFEVKTRISHERPSSYIIGGTESTDEHITLIPRQALTNDDSCCMRRLKSHKSSQFMFNDANSFAVNGSEHWIKTDSDYLVLEL